MSEHNHGSKDVENDKESLQATIAERLPLKDVRSRRWFLNVWTLVGVVALTWVVGFLLNLLAIPVAMIVWTIIFVFCLRGLVDFFECHHISRLWGTTLAYVIMIVVLIVLGLLLFSPAFGLSDQFSSLLKNIPNYVDQITAWLNSMYEQYSSVLNNEAVHNVLKEVQDNISSWASSLAEWGANGIVSAGTTVVNSFIAIGFAFVIAFWVLLELPAIGRETKRLIGPKHAEDAEFLHLTFTRVMGGYIKALLLQCVAIGGGCVVLFLILRIPNAAALGAITGVFNILPIIGPWLGGALAAIVGIFISPLVAIIALVGTVVIQQFVYTFVSPRIMQNSVDVHPALTFIALMAGSAIGGAMSGLTGSLVGMLLSIPLVAVVKAIFVYYFEKNTGRRIVAEDGFLFKGVTSEGSHPDPIADATSPTFVGGTPEERAKRRASGFRQAYGKRRWSRQEGIDGKEEAARKTSHGATEEVSVHDDATAPGNAHDDAEKEHDDIEKEKVGSSSSEGDDGKK